ncbi:PaaI family thioesterase [Crateriforma spongiae]|uniref:PaaI family thioesterase n=1 Tax=Crateriforma spongiae TaxID=2724528 RepID=UPI0039B0A17A
MINSLDPPGRPSFPKVHSVLPVQSERFSTAPISRLVGFDVQPPADPDSGTPLGHAVVRIQCGPQHHNPMGRVHGGLVSALADAAMGIAFGRTLLESEDFSTIEMKINFIRPVKDGLLTATATVVERGLRIGFVQCDITGPKGKLVATATSTCTVLSQS